MPLDSNVTSCSCTILSKWLTLRTMCGRMRLILDKIKLIYNTRKKEFKARNIYWDANGSEIRKRMKF